MGWFSKNDEKTVNGPVNENHIEILLEKHEDLHLMQKLFLIIIAIVIAVFLIIKIKNFIKRKMDSRIQRQVMKSTLNLSSVKTSK